MKIPVSWLREYVAVPEDEPALDVFNDMLTMAGLEVEEILTTPAGPTLYTKITPNRGDWASVYGTAREAAAAGRLMLKPLPSVLAMATSGSSSDVSVTIEDPVGCPRYSVTVVRGIVIGPSPQWMQDRLTAAGMRPVSNVVDVTNYVMLELGQPLHAFDLDQLPGGAVVVRKATAGETITTLDGIVRSLSPETLCICDREKPIGIAGIMGGGPTEVTDGTVNILLESAHFDPGSIRRTAKRLPLATEASFRFERFVDPNLVPIAAARAAQLLAEVAGGMVGETLDVFPAPKPPTRIMARVERIRRLLGVDMDRDEMIAGLERLGVSVERSAGALDCIIPAWRPDLTIEDDIAEEVGRIALGYENLPTTIPPLKSGRGADSPHGRFTDAVRETLVRAGMQDVRTHSLTPPTNPDLVTAEEFAQAIAIRTPLSADASTLRTSLLPNLIAIAARAQAAGIRDIAGFEVGPVYHRVAAGAYAEPLRISGILSGSAMPAAWSIKPDALPADLYYAKGIVETLCASLGIDSVVAVPGTHPATHPGRTAQLSVGDTPIGLVAELSEATIDAQNLPRRVYVFDLDGDSLAGLSSAARGRYRSIPRFPSITRDLAPVFDTSVPFTTIERAAIAAAGPLLESLRLIDVYTGPNLGPKKCSITLRFTFRSLEGTLKDAPVESALNEVRAALTSLGGELRG